MMVWKNCRLCLGQFPIYFSLLNTDISQMLESLTSIKVTEDDQLSTVTCTKCLLNLKLAFKIQQNILKIDRKLRNNCPKYVEIKIEPTELIIGGRNEIVPTKICDNLCRICGSCIDDEKSMIKHLQQHFQSVQECRDCGATFKNIHDYRQHLFKCQQDNVEGKIEFYTCNTCNINFRYASLYHLHMKKHLNIVSTNNNSEKIADKQDVSCNICLKTFETVKELKSHTHNRRECPICGVAVSRNNWSKHVKNHTSGKQICELCGATLKSVESLRVHMQITHSTKCFKCNECNVTFKVHYNYMKHCKSHHTGEKDHICEKCGKRFVTKYYLNKHIKLKHLQIRPHICEFCAKAFSSRCALITHRRQHTNETPYRCEVCGQGFRQNVSLRAHRKSKHNIIEPITCACKVCGKQFSSQQAIHSHMRLHY